MLQVHQHNILNIKYFNSYWKENGYNLSWGGDGNGGLNGKLNGMYGRKHSKESIEKMKLNRKGKCLGDNNPMTRLGACSYIKRGADGKFLKAKD